MRPIPAKIKATFTSRESLAGFQCSLQHILSEYSAIDKPSDDEKLIGVNLSEMLKKVSKKCMDGQLKTTINLTASEALAYLIAYKTVNLNRINQYQMIKVMELAHAIDKVS